MLAVSAKRVPSTSKVRLNQPTSRRKFSSIGRTIYRTVRLKSQGLNNELTENSLHFGRVKPEGIEELVTNTKFSKKELQLMYRGFKQECPSGVINEDSFKAIYAQFFPQGDCSRYAHYVFKTFDKDGNGTISFEEFVMGLSILVRGTTEEKVHWAFTLYDINKDGVITKDEMLDIVTAIYAMMGRHSYPPVDSHTPPEHAEQVFKRMDQDRDGVITEKEFMDACMGDENIVRAIVMFDTVM